MPSKRTPSQLYREQVELTPAAKAARAAAREASEKFGSPYRFVNLRRPFRMLASLSKKERAEIRKLARSNGIAGKTLETLAKDDAWASMELVDVVDRAGSTKYRLYTWAYGCGSLIDARQSAQVGAIIQHTYDPRPGDLELRRALAAAYASGPITEVIDFALEREATIEAPELAKPTVLERVVDGRQVWAWLRFAIDGDASALDVLQRSLSRDEVLAIPPAVTEGTDVHEIIAPRAKPVFRGGMCEWHYPVGDAELNERAIRALRVIGVLVASVRGAYDVSREGDESHWTGMIACYALIAKGGSFPDDAMALALRAHWAPDPMAEEPIRPILEAMTLPQRERYVARRKLDFETTSRVVIVDGKRKKVPHAAGLWTFADLIPTRGIARRAVEAVERWNPVAQPEERAITVIRSLGPQCVPFLDASIARAKGRNRDVLRKARALFPSAVRLS